MSADGVLHLQNTRVIDERIDNLDRVLDITLVASNWIGNIAPYSQTVSNANITSASNPKLFGAITDNMTAQQRQAYLKAYSRVVSGYGVTADGSVTFYVWDKPDTDITVRLKGA